MGIFQTDFLLDNLPVAVLVVDLGGKIVYANRSMEQFIKFNRDELVGHHFKEVLQCMARHSPDSEAMDPLQETLESGIEFKHFRTLIKARSWPAPLSCSVYTKRLIDGDNFFGACAVYQKTSVEVCGEGKGGVLPFSFTEQFETIYAFAEAIGARDLYTMGHSEKVAEYARLIAERMGLEGKELELLYLCGIVHDVGKIAVPENVLNKPGSLSPEEFKQIMLHPERGAAILSHISFLDKIVPVILSHHERYDGTGYPRGLKGEEIPLLARILSVADAFDAMTSDRSYRKALPLDKVIQELKNNAGTQFDPKVVEVFLKLLKEYL